MKDQRSYMKTEYTLFVQPPNTMPRINSIYAFVSVDAVDGNEGVVAAPYGGQSCLPLIAADEERLKELIPIAEKIATIANMKIRLVKFSTREVIKEINPNEKTT